MNLSIKLLAFALLVFLCGTGCTSVATVRQDYAHGAGDARVYAASEARVHTAARDVLTEEGAALEDDVAAHCLFGSFASAGLHWGGYVGVCTSALEDGRTRVVAITRRRYQLGFVTPLTENGFHAELARKLAGGAK